MNRRQSVGTFTTDTALVVQSWDSWMAESTGLPEFAACGQPLASLFPELANRGMLSRLRRVADGAGVEVLAPAFHKYLIPCPPREVTSRLERMRQHVTMAPLRDRTGVVGVVVTIEDVTAAFERERRLASDLDSDDEGTRLRAAETIAAAGESPVLLAGALTDESWRVRRVAADGLASAGGSEVIATLIEALRSHHRDPALLNGCLTALGKTRDDVAESVIALLELSDAEVRTYACLALGLIADPRAVPHLVRHLDDPDTNVRFHAIEALGRIRDGEVSDALVQIAEQRDFFLAFAALDALAAIGEPDVVPRLLPLLDEPALLAATVSCLGALAGEETALPLARLIERADAPVADIARALVDIHDRLQSQIGEGGLVADLARSVMTPATASALEGALENASAEDSRGLLQVLSWLPFDGINRTLASCLARPELRQLSAVCLAKRGEAASADILAVASTGAADTRRAAAEVLGRLGSKDATPTLITWLDDEPEVIIATAGALGAIGDARAFRPLLAVLDHSEAAVRQAAVSALNSIGHPRMEEAVAARLSDPSPRIRESAARIAGYFGYASCLRRVVDLCDDEDEIVRRAAVEHLASYDQPQAWAKIHESLRKDSSASVRAAAARAMGHTTALTAIHALIDASRDPNLWVRYFSIRSLGRQRVADTGAITCLAECATRDDAPPVRIAAIDSLALLGSRSVALVLTALAHDRDVDVACAAVTALAVLDAQSSEPALRFALESGEPRLMRAAFATVSAQRANYAVPVLAGLARELRDDDLRREVVLAIGRIGGPAGLRTLIDLSVDRTLREAATAALGSLGDDDADTMRAMLSDPDQRRRRVIVDGLARMKNRIAASILATALEDPSPSVRLAATRALGRLDLRDARTQLAALAGMDDSVAVRAAAQDALSR